MNKSMVSKNGCTISTYICADNPPISEASLPNREYNWSCLPAIWQGTCTIAVLKWQAVILLSVTPVMSVAICDLQFAICTSRLAQVLGCLFWWSSRTWVWCFGTWYAFHVHFVLEIHTRFYVEILLHNACHGESVVGGFPCIFSTKGYIRWFM